MEKDQQDQRTCRKRKRDSSSQIERWLSVREKFGEKDFFFNQGQYGCMSQTCFEVKDSLIEGAGKGCFTRVRIPAGVKLMEYKGKEDQTNTDNADAHHEHRYCFELDSKTCINAYDVKKSNKARFINDVHGTSKRANLRWMVSLRHRKVWVVSTRTIAAGAELYISYGDRYWD